MPLSRQSNHQEEHDAELEPWRWSGNLKSLPVFGTRCEISSPVDRNRFANEAYFVVYWNVVHAAWATYKYPLKKHAQRQLGKILNSGGIAFMTVAMRSPHHRECFIMQRVLVAGPSSSSTEPSSGAAHDERAAAHQPILPLSDAFGPLPPPYAEPVPLHLQPLQDGSVDSPNTALGPSIDHTDTSHGHSDAAATSAPHLDREASRPTSGDGDEDAAHDAGGDRAATERMEDSKDGSEHSEGGEAAAAAREREVFGSASESDTSDRPVVAHESHAAGSSHGRREDGVLQSAGEVMETMVDDSRMSDGSDSEDEDHECVPGRVVPVMTSREALKRRVQDDTYEALNQGLAQLRSTHSVEIRSTALGVRNVRQKSCDIGCSTHVMGGHKCGTMIGGRFNGTVVLERWFCSTGCVAHYKWDQAHRAARLTSSAPAPY